MNNQTKTIRELMPDRFTRLILAELGGGHASKVSEVVNTEDYNNKRYWPVIEKFAREKDEEAFEKRMEYLMQKREQISNAA